MSSERSEDDPLSGGQYRYIEYRQESGTIAVIQDAESDHAWIQSTVSVPAEP